MTKFIMVRHGETQLNRSGCFQGRINKPLNDYGRMQAAFVRDRLKEEQIDAIYTSPLLRAKETGDIIKGSRPIKFVIDDGLIEMNFGVWEGRGSDEVSQRWPEQLEIWRTSPDQLLVDGGEIMKDVQERMYETFWEIAKKEEGKTVLITAHMVCLQLLMMKFHNDCISDIWKVKQIANASLNIVEAHKDQKVQILAWSEDSFVPKQFKLGYAPVTGVNC